MIVSNCGDNVVFIVVLEIGINFSDVGLFFFGNIYNLNVLLLIVIVWVLMGFIISLLLFLLVVMSYNGCVLVLLNIVIWFC